MLISLKVFSGNIEPDTTQLVSVVPDSIQAVNEMTDSILIIRTELIDYAKEFIGTHYRYAGMDPKTGFDCSGYVQYVFHNFNIQLPRSSREYKTMGNSLKPEDFKIGDIVVFYSFRDKTRIGHVGIICEANGMNSKFIHSSSARSKGVIISELNSKSYTNRFYKCIDVIEGR